MKLISRTLVLLTAAITLTGCLASTKYDKSTGDIRLRPVIGIGTRSGKEFIPFPEDRKFNVFAISQDTGRKFLDDVAVTYGARGAGSRRILRNGQWKNHLNSSDITLPTFR